MVGLHKDRHVFALSLCVARLSGVGSDTLFIGILRQEPSSGTTDNPVLKASLLSAVWQWSPSHHHLDCGNQLANIAAEECGPVVGQSHIVSLQVLFSISRFAVDFGAC